MVEQVKLAKTIVDNYGYLYRCSFDTNTPTEEKVCLRFEKSKYHIFYVEKGIMYDEMTFVDVNNACVEMIIRSILDKSVHQQAIEEYYNKLVADSSIETKKSTLKHLIHSEALRALKS